MRVVLVKEARGVLSAYNDYVPQSLKQISTIESQ
jgi:hypothetical protein